MDEPTKLYRIRPYTYGFEIQKYYFNKKKGEGSWLAYKYPRDLKSACETLLDLFVHERTSNKDTENTQILIDAVKAAQEDVRKVAEEVELSGIL